MKILLLGATGRTGLKVLNEALENNFHVIVLARNPQKIRIRDPKLNIVKGDVTNEIVIKKLIQDVDLVISTLGHRYNSPKHLLRDSMKIVLKYLKTNQRVIALTGFGVHDSKDVPINTWGKLSNLLVKLLPSNVWNDGVDLGNLLYKSNKKYILVRAPRIINGDKRGKYKAGYFKTNLLDKISTSDIADFMIKNVENEEWINQSPILKY